VKEKLRRWSEDERVGRALAVAGIVLLAVQLMPDGLVHALARLWPLAVIAVGVLLIVRGTTKRSA
jgi:hypothetical protein